MKTSCGEDLSTDDEDDIEGLDEIDFGFDDDIQEESPEDDSNQDNITFDDEEEDYFITDSNDENVEPVATKNNKSNEPIYSKSKRLEIPLVGTIIVLVVLAIIVVCLIIFKDQLLDNEWLRNLGINITREVKDDVLNEDEQRAFDLITKWLESYTKTSEDIKNKITSYKINTVSLIEKNDTKSIIMATFDVVPASIENTNWLDNNGTREGDTIKNKTRYFVIEKIDDNYEIINSKAERPDINEDTFTLEKAIISIKSDFPDQDNVDLHLDSSLISSLDENKKNEVLSKVGGTLDDYYTITGSYRRTYILGTFLINKETQKKWFVDDSGKATELKSCVQILHLSDFEVQGDLSMTLEQAILTTFNLFPKGNRQGLTLVENWIENVDKREEVVSTLGEISDYYVFKTTTSKGYIAIKKNGLAKFFINTDGTITDLIEVKDITSIIQ